MKNRTKNLHHFQNYWKIRYENGRVPLDMSARLEVLRKTAHLMSLGIPVLAFYSVLYAQLALLSFILIYSVSEQFKMKGVRFWPNRIITFLQRDEEKLKWAKAPLLLALGVLLCITVFSWKAATFAIFVIGFCDTMASVSGQAFGGTPIPFSNQKTFTGTLCFIACCLPVALYTMPPSKAIVITLVAAFLESLPFKDWDNLTVPVIVGYLAHHFIGLY